MLRLLLLVLVLVASLRPAQAAGPVMPDGAVLAYKAGRYAEAARVAEQAGTAHALAFAARALIADAITRPDGLCTDCLRQAVALARRASSLDPMNVEAHLQEAVALGFLGRSMGVFAARREGLAEKVREQLDKALAIEPGNPWARASLGAWHLEIVTHAGALLATILYGAEESDGLSLYRTALRDLPDEALLRLQFALALLALDQDERLSEAREVLQGVAAATREDAMTGFARDRARQLLAAIASKRSADIRRLVLKFQGYPSAEP